MWVPDLDKLWGRQWAPRPVSTDQAPALGLRCAATFYIWNTSVKHSLILYLLTFLNANK